MATYSFIDVAAAIAGPGAAFSLGYGSGNAEEGITVERSEDVNQMTIGADGEVMHSLHAGKGGTVTIRLLKTSPTNKLLSAAYAMQTAASSLHGLNVITITRPNALEVITCRDVAFKKFPSLNWAKDGGVVEWTFDAGKIDGILG